MSVYGSRQIRLTRELPPRAGARVLAEKMPGGLGSLRLNFADCAIGYQSYFLDDCADMNKVKYGRTYVRT